MDIIAERWFEHRKPRRLVAILVSLALLAGVAAVQLTIAPAGATSVAGTFELDGNPQASSAPGDDWQTLLTSSGSALAKTAMPIVDGADSPSDTSYFKGGGSKDERDISLWQHSGTDVAPDKDEIVNAAAAAYLVEDQESGPTGDDDRADGGEDLVIAFHSDRYSNDGDAAIGFWFFKNRITLNSNGHFNGVHSIGDVLVVSDFNEGEGINTIKVFTWTANGLTEVAIPGLVPKDCQASGHNQFVCATENRTDQDDVASVWPYTPKANVGTTMKYPDFTFLEGGINLSHIVPASDRCFASFLAETRSATSTTAQLKDFALGDFPICSPSTTLTSSVSPATIHGGESVTWTLVETNSGTSPISNVTVTDAATSAPCTFAYVSGDLNTNSILDPASLGVAAESWTYTCTKTLSATTTLSAYASGTDTIGGKVVTGSPVRCTFNDSVTPPTGTPKTGYTLNTICDPKERASSTVTVINPSTTLTNRAAEATPNPVRAGENVTFTFYEKNDGDQTLGTPTLTEQAGPGGVLTGCNPTEVMKAQDTSTVFDETSRNAGDTNNDDLFNVGEEWKFSCTTSFAAGSTSGTVRVIGHANDSLGKDVTYFETGTTTKVACIAGSVVGGNFCDLDEKTSKSVTVINPGTFLREDVSAVITFTYYEKNVGDSTITSPSVTSTCAGTGTATAKTEVVDGVTYNVGDTNRNLAFNALETWVYTCTTTAFSIADATAATATYTDASEGHGIDASGLAVGATNETDSSSVKLTRGKLASSVP